MRPLGSILVSVLAAFLAGCGATGSPSVPSVPPSGLPASPGPSASSLASTVPPPTPSASAVALLPVGSEPPAAPTDLTAIRREVPCASPIASRSVVAIVQLAGTGPGCMDATLGWLPASRTDAVYRIYLTESGEGADAVCYPAEARLIATSEPNASGMTVGPLEISAGGGELCLFVAAANSAGESARVKFSNVSR